MRTDIAHLEQMLYHLGMKDFQGTAGEIIRYARLSLGWTQQGLADKLNESLQASEIIERSMISRWEKDKNFPRK